MRGSGQRQNRIIDFIVLTSRFENDKHIQKSRIQLKPSDTGLIVIYRIQCGQP